MAASLVDQAVIGRWFMVDGLFASETLMSPAVYLYAGVVGS